eukprot:s1300_g1.t1
MGSALCSGEKPPVHVCRFPMYVMKVSDFLEMEGPPEPHDILVEKNVLHIREPGMFVLFVSHQWLGSEHPDPTGQQLSVLRCALRRMLSGRLSVEEDLTSMTPDARLAHGSIKKISPEQVQQIGNGYLFLDWFAIPQITARKHGVNEEETRSDAARAVQSIPAYVEGLGNPSLISLIRSAHAMSRRSGSGTGGYGSGYGRGGGGGGQQWYGQRSGPNMAHNPYVVQMPHFMEPIAEGPEDSDRSIIVIDNRDDRMVSPFQTWLVSEIMANAASSINVLTERDQVMPPSSGFHLSLFGNYTLDGIKVVVAISIESVTGNTCGGWDSETAKALSHAAFQPFNWPMLRDTSASYVDMKIYNGNEILFHWIFRGFRSDTDLTVQQQFVDEYFVREASKGRPRLSVVVAVFMGWRVSVLSFECGGRTYSIGPRGSVGQGRGARTEFAQLAAVHEHWWNSSVARAEDEVGVSVIFVENLEPGNFHVQARSKLFERAPELVAQKALAEMNHTVSTPAPVGPPALTAEAWLRADLEVVDRHADRGSEELAAVRQHGIELNVRSFDVRHTNQGEAGHVVDEDRDKARMDRRFARSTAGLTPMVFAEEMQRRSYNSSMARIEEVEEPQVIQQTTTGRSSQSQAATAGRDPHPAVWRATCPRSRILKTEKKKWGRRLSQISDRAGKAAGINDPAQCVGLAPAEAAQLRSLAFEAGGFRTIRQNVRNWEKFEEWAAGKGLRVYPPTIVAVMSYSQHLRDQGCGPAVLPAFKYAVGWICKRLAMSCPEMGDVRLKALIDTVMLPKLIFEKKNAAAITVWWVLILIYASLRFDDGIHVAPSSLVMTQDALLGVVWQTKVERKRRGTRFAVPTCSISGTEWLSMGWDLFKPYRSDRDYFVWELKNEKEFNAAPVTYSRGLSWLKSFMLRGLAEAQTLKLIEVNEVDDLERTVREVTWHSMRVTMLSEAVKARVDDKIVGLQANWKDPSQLVLKYARQRKELSVAMVKSMTEKLRQEWVPDQQHFVIEEEDEEVTEPIVPEFIVKSSLPASALSSSDLRCHIFDRWVSEDSSICGRLKLRDAASVGTQAPGMICQLCKGKAGI